MNFDRRPLKHSQRLVILLEQGSVAVVGCRSVKVAIAKGLSPHST